MDGLFYLLGCYLLGNFLTGFFLLRLLGGKNIMDEGSGNPGARNAGRVHGKLAFILTFLGDAAKGAAAVWAGSWLGLPEEIQLLGVGAAVLGHMRPIFFMFRGGKGVSALLGGLLAFDPMYAAVVIAAFLCIYLPLRSFTKAGLAALLILPLFQLIQGRSLAVCGITLALILVVASAHIGDLKERQE